MPASRGRGWSFRMSRAALPRRLSPPQMLPVLRMMMHRRLAQVAVLRCESLNNYLRLCAVSNRSILRCFASDLVGWKQAAVDQIAQAVND